MIWKTRDGKEIEVKDLTNDHLKRIIVMVAGAGNRIREHEIQKMLTGIQPSTDASQDCFDNNMKYIEDCDWREFYPDDKQPLIKALDDEARKRATCAPS